MELEWHKIANLFILKGKSKSISRVNRLSYLQKNMLISND